MSAGLAGPGGEGLPPSCLGHQHSKIRRRDGAVVYLYDLWPLPDVPRPARGRVEQAVVCGTCGRHLVYRVSSRARARRGRLLKWAAALALLAVLGGHIAAFVVLVRRDDAPLDDLVGAGFLAWLLLLPICLIVIGTRLWDAGARLVPGARQHVLRPPGATKTVIERYHDPYVL